MLEPLPLISLSVAELLAVLAVLALASVRWLPERSRTGVRIAALAASAVALAAILAAGPRWVLIPVLAAFLLALPGTLTALARARRGRPARTGRRWAAVLGTLVLVGLTGAGVALAIALPVPRLPVPTGPYPVGTRVVQWTDPARPEPAEPAERRVVVAQLWYPALPSDGPRAQLLGRTAAEVGTVAAAVADQYGLPAFLLDGPARARSHARPRAEPAAGRFPVVLFSPGLGAVRTQSTAWAEELASRGYVVAALDHPYDSAAVQLADGRVITSRLAATGDDAEDNRRALRAIEIRAADLSFVRQRLADPAGPLAGRLDPNRVAVAGHSLGGAAALLAARLDPEFGAVIDLDGYPRDPSPDPYPQPVLALRHQPDGEETADYGSRLTEALRRSRATGYLIMVPGTAHLTFTDAPLYLPPLPGLTGSLGRTEGLAITARASADFLDSAFSGTDPAPRLARHGEFQVID